MLNDFTRLAPRRPARGKKRVERIFCKYVTLAAAGDSGLYKVKITELFENGKIDNQITDRDSRTRLTLFRLENAEWKILNRKMRIARDVKETAQRRIHEYY